MSVQLEGADRVRAKTTQIRRKVASGSREQVQRSAAEMESTAKGLAPVRSGTLRDSIQAQVSKDGLSAYVVATAKHAAYVEFGTRRTAAHPFLFPAQEEQRRPFMAGLRGVIRGALGGAG